METYHNTMTNSSANQNSKRQSESQPNDNSKKLRLSTQPELRIGVANIVPLSRTNQPLDDDEALPILSIQDPGCDVTAIDVAFLSLHPSFANYAKWTPVQSINFDLSKTNNLGYINLQITSSVTNKSANCRAIIVPKSSHPLTIGYDILQQLYPDYFEKFAHDFSPKSTFRHITTLPQLLRYHTACDLDRAADQFNAKELQANAEPINFDNEDRTSRLTKRCNPSYVEQLEHVLGAFPDVFSEDSYDIGSVQHEFDSVVNMTRQQPISVKYRLKRPNEQAELQKICYRLHEVGIIRPSNSPWCSQAFVVPKRNGKWRLVINYAPINKYMEKDSLPQPNPHTILDRLKGSAIYSSLDMTSGFWMVNISDADARILAFNDGCNLWEFTRLPQGIVNGPAVMQRVMTKILRKHIDAGYCTVYQDDILIHSKTPEEHINHLHDVLQSLSDAQAKCSISKCDIGYEAIKFLGHIVTKDFINPDPDKLAALVTLKPPVNIAELHSVLGLFNVFRRFIPNFSIECSPLHELKQKNQPFAMDDRRLRCFERVKDLVINCKGIRMIDFSPTANPIIVQTDASKIGIAGCAVQKQDGRYYYVLFFSMSLTPTMKKFADKHEIAKLELMAITQFCSKYSYVLYRPFIICCDNQAVVESYQNPNCMSGFKTSQWNKISDLLFTIKWIGTKQNIVADYLSRNPLPAQSDIHMNSNKYPNRVAKEIAIHNIMNPPASFIDGIVSSQSPPIHNNDDDNTDKQSMISNLSNRSQQTNLSSSTVVSVALSKINPESITSDAIEDQNDAHTLDKLSQHEEINIKFVAEKDRQKLMRDAHNSYFYPCRDAMYNLLRQYFTWPNMYKEVAEFVRNCQHCSQYNHRNYKNVPRYKIRHITAIGSLLSMDYAEIPVPGTMNKIYLLVFVDVASKYTIVVPTLSQDASHTVRALKRVFRTIIPKQIITDNYSSFNSAAVTKLLETYRIELLKCYPHHHAPNGPAENRIKILKKKIAMANALGAPVDNILIAQVVSRLNEIPHSATGKTPFELWFGRSPNFALRNYLDSLVFKTLPTNVVQHHKKIQARMEKNLNKDSNKVQYQLGETVWLRNQARRNLEPIQSHLVTIIEKAHGSAYRVQDESGKITIQDSRFFTKSSQDLILQHSYDMSSEFASSIITEEPYEPSLSDPEENHDGLV